MRKSVCISSASLLDQTYASVTDFQSLVRMEIKYHFLIVGR